MSAPDKLKTDSLSAWNAVKAVAAYYGVPTDNVYAWIHSGELAAIDVSEKPGEGRRRYRISREAIEEFEERRSNKPPAPKPKRRRRQKATAGKEYF